MTANAELVVRIAAIGDRLVTRILREQYEDPFWHARYGDRADRRGREDGNFHLQYLAQALAEGRPEVLENYARWLQSLLCARGMCSRHLGENFDRLGRAIADENLPAGTDAVALLAAATAALRYPNGTPARRLQDQSAAIIAALAPALARSYPTVASRIERDVAELIDYAADARALGSPTTFEAHAAWLPGYFTQQGLPVGYTEALLSAVRGAVAATT